MSGDRKDKERAWKRLDEVLKLQDRIAGTLASTRGKKVQVFHRDMISYVVHDLQESGRLSSRQIILIKKLVESVIGVERNL